MLFLFCLHGTIAAQTKISGIVNACAKVTDISNHPQGAELKVDDASLFGVHDTVLLIRMTGVSKDGNHINGAGKYEFHIVRYVDTVAGAVHLFTYVSTETESLQLIRVPSFTDAEVVGELTCKSWDGNTGGVLALIVNNTLTLSADINVSEKGFRGGGLSGSTQTICGVPHNLSDYPDGDVNAAGYKGEGNVQKVVFINNPRGKGAAWSGGGGGNDVYGGGGGGGNGGVGGNGGPAFCIFSSFTEEDLAEGGKGYREDYHDIWKDRIFMGGGGGSGTGANTPGGNGGGIAVIVAGKLAFAGDATIRANGASVAGSPSNGGAGGGGAGGSVMIMAGDYGDLNVEIKGGNGGNTENFNCIPYSPSGSYGVGGGGGGGILHVHGSIEDIPLYHVIRDRGRNGMLANECGISQDLPATSGIILDHAELQLRGFFYNIITTPDTFLCYNTAKTINASQPRGGANHQYQYLWEKKIRSNGNWEAVGNQQYYTTPPVTDTVFLRRTVTAYQNIEGVSQPVSDVSAPVRITPVPPVANNLLTTPDTIFCGNVSDLFIEGLPASGALGNFAYLWQENINGAGWQQIEGASEVDFPAALQEGSLQYRRIVVSGDASACCADTSRTLSVTVLPVIAGNELSPAGQELCETENADLIEGTATLEGGDGKFACKWQFVTNGQDWSHLGHTEDSYLPVEKYTGEGYYRRIVTSGRGDCCADTSEAAVIRRDRMPVGISAGEDQILHFKFNTELNATISEGTGMWQATNLVFSDPESAVTHVSGLETGVNALKWTVTNGVCPPVSDSMTVEVRDIFIPSGFSPNNDRLNDCFGMLGVENAESFELVIINRNNKIVYQTSSVAGGYPYPCLWDGKSASGRELPSDTYFYRLTTGEGKTYKGHVILKR
ncbi:MAG: gliding motility-associated C-terminal domain-containing protein [Bacteroidales bacterium]|nr:gliding motility-associated C-terminal domain-containing protein [Bacteroidales bacterium]